MITTVFNVVTTVLIMRLSIKLPFNIKVKFHIETGQRPVRTCVYTVP